MRIPGYGIFTYDDSLVLTDANQNKRTIWRLPYFFHPTYGTKMTYHENIMMNLIIAIERFRPALKHLCDEIAEE